MIRWPSARVVIQRRKVGWIRLCCTWVEGRERVTKLWSSSLISELSRRRSSSTHLAYTRSYTSKKHWVEMYCVLCISAYITSSVWKQIKRIMHYCTHQNLSQAKSAGGVLLHTQDSRPVWKHTNVLLYVQKHEPFWNFMYSVPKVCIH